MAEVNVLQNVAGLATTLAPVGVLGIDEEMYDNLVGLFHSYATKKHLGTNFKYLVLQDAVSKGIVLVTRPGKCCPRALSYFTCLPTFKGVLVYTNCYFEWNNAHSFF